LIFDLDIQTHPSEGPNRSSVLCEFGAVVPCCISRRIRVPRIKRVSTISRIWRINGRQTVIVNSGVSGRKFTKFLYDADRTSALLTRPSTFPSCHPLWNASPKKEGVSPTSADFALKSVTIVTSLDRSSNQHEIEHPHKHVYQPCKCGEDRSCGF